MFLQTLPGELRNEVYHLLLNDNITTTHPLRLSKAGVLIAPPLAHTNNLIRRELCSLLEHKPTPVLEAQVIDFDTGPLHAFLLANPTKQHATTVKLTLLLTRPAAERAHYAALRDFLRDSTARGWSVGYRVHFDWARFSLGEAAESARRFAEAFVSSEQQGDAVAAAAAAGEARSSNAGEGLWRAMRKAREAEVRRCLVERPARQRALMGEGRLPGRVLVD